MGRAKPLNGTVGATFKRIKQVKTALEAGDTEKVMAFLNEAISVCESNEYTVLTADNE